MSGSPLKPFVSLKRLRRGFIVLGTLLLLGLLSLSLAVQGRLDEARREREEMVAARVFDELERELSAFLDGEGQRGPYQSLQTTDPSTWAPFVIGYFTREGRGIDVVAADGATSENRRRILWALDRSLAHINVKDPEEENEEKATEPSPPPVPTPRKEEGAATRKRRSVNRAQAPLTESEAAPAPIQAEHASESEIIQQLNRAPARRKSPSKTKKKQGSGSSKDPFLDYTESY